MFNEPTITWVPSGFSGYIWLDTKIVLKKKNPHSSILCLCCTVAYLGFHKEGPNFRWPLVLTQRGPKHVFLYFPMTKKNLLPNLLTMAKRPPKNMPLMLQDLLFVQLY